MKYDVKVSEECKEDKYYCIDIVRQCEEKPEEAADSSSQKEDKSDNEIVNNDPAMVLEISRTEYEHSVKRLDRFDNKVYILLTVCAFIFVMLTSAIGNIGETKIPETCVGWIVVVIYIGVVVAAIIMTVALLKGLIGALSSIALHRLDSPDITDYNMALADRNQVARYVIGIYEQSTKINNGLINEKYKTVDQCVNLLIKTVIVLIVATCISIVIPKANEGERKISDIVTVIEECLVEHMTDDSGDAVLDEDADNSSGETQIIENETVSEE